MTEYAVDLSALHQRIADFLGWPLKDVQSFHLRQLRELVRPLSPKLVYEITLQIERLRKI